MFTNEDDYRKATEHAQVNTYEDKKTINIKLIIINIVLLSVIGYLGYLYLKNETTYLSQNQFNTKLAVLGVSHKSTESEYDDKEFMNILNNTQVDSVKEASSDLVLSNLNNAMSALMSESSMKNQSSYSAAISKELDDKDSRDYRVVLVKKGDTLSTLSQKYYGDSTVFEKIIKANNNLTEQSHTVYVGQTLNIPY